MRDLFEGLRGNEKQKKFFRREIEAETLAHAYILEGGEGTGKHTLALAAAEALTEEEELRKKIAKGICPDVKIFSLPPDKKMITVDTVRRLKADAYVKPNDLSFKFYILEHAECMNIQAQNAALKLLEEPPDATYFFLLCENASALLPTVRSRAPVIRMQRFSFEELEELLMREERVPEKRKSDEEGFLSAVRNSGGSYGKALHLLEKKEDGVARTKAEEFLQCIQKRDKAVLLTAVYHLPSKRQEFDEVVAFLQLALRDMMLIRCGGGEKTLFWFSSGENAEQASRNFTRKEILCMYDCLTRLREDLLRNINIQNARMALVTGLYTAEN